MSKLVALIILTTLFIFPYLTNAQSKGVEVTQDYKIEDTDIQEGDIMSVTENGVMRSKVVRDARMLGVYQANPLVVFRNTAEGFNPVVRQGSAYVNVTNIAGPIKRGDFITSSGIPGKGQKATENGYVLGIASANFDESQAQDANYQGINYKVGQIPVDIRIENAEIGQVSLSRALDLVLTEVVKSVGNPGQVGQFTKYAAALLVFLSSLLFSFIAFFRVIVKGIEALGRNPLARTSIQISIILNVLLVIGISIVGLIAAIVIIRF